MTGLLNYWMNRTNERFEKEVKMIHLPPLEEGQPDLNKKPFFQSALQRTQSFEEKVVAVREWTSRNPENNTPGLRNQLPHRLPDAQLEYKGYDRSTRKYVVGLKWDSDYLPVPAPRA
ncbi:MAG: hypothetical protein HY366_02955 [Candidatus Aenigmarchaeota archaeon]|nr:hypothetical protein [Candidatus Aenigmarchaeota archaeon]